MTTSQTTRSWPSAAAIADGANLTSVSRQYLDDIVMPGEFIRRLVHGGRLADAIRFLAQSMSLREAIWWACLCSEPAISKEGDPESEKALAAVVDWIQAPDDKSREIVKARAEIVNRASLAGMLARAATLGDEIQARKLAAGVVLLAASKSGKTWLNFQQFLCIGLDVAHGEIPWE